jgi:hypothetical protein
MANRLENSAIIRLHGWGIGVMNGDVSEGATEKYSRCLHL